MLDGYLPGARLQPEVLRHVAELSRWKWYAPLLSLLFQKAVRLSELRRAVPALSTKVLVQNLLQLEAGSSLGWISSESRIVRRQDQFREIAPRASEKARRVIRADVR